MSFFLKYNEEKRLYESCFEGLLSLDEVLKHYRDFYIAETSARMVNSELRELVDLSAVEFSGIPADGVREIARLYLELREELSIDRIVLSIFAPTDISFGMARVFLAWANDGVFEVGVFRDKDEALDFIART